MLACATAVGAWVHRPIPLVVVAIVAVVVAATRHPGAVIGGGLILASWLGARSYDGLRPVVARPVTDIVTLVRDPSPSPFGWSADVRLRGRRVELVATGGAGGALSASLAGERLSVEGRLVPPPTPAPWLVPRHVVGRLLVTRADRVGGGSAPWRAANRFRRLLAVGTSGMSPGTRSLYSGFVLGDDRDQTPEVIDDFRGAGLTHLLVVSGQNVAFVLVLASPLLERMGWRGRWMLTLSVIAAFGVVTRFEPSVLRASAMAAIAVTSGALGRPSSAVRTLALAVTGLVLIDPLLVRSVGFQLSVGASLAIAVLAVPIADLLPGPRALAAALGVTLAAQVGVAPVLIPLTGGLPVVSLVTNPLSVPVAGLITTWGLAAGVVAGVAGPGVAVVVHAPTVVMISWVAGVARVGSSLPLGSFGWVHLVLLGAAAVVARRVARLRWLAAGVVLVTVAAPAVMLARPPPARVLEHVSVFRARGATVVVVNGSPQPLPVLQDLRMAGIRRVDVAVVPGRTGQDIVRSIRHRWPIGEVIDPSSAPAERVTVGGLVVTITGDGRSIVTAVNPGSGHRVGR